MTIENRNGREFHVTLRLGQAVIGQVTLKMTCEGFKLGDSKSYMGVNKSTGFISHKFLPSCNVTGNIAVNGAARQIVGYGYIIHALQGNRPYLLSKACDFALLADPATNSSLFAVSFLTTPENGQIPVSNGTLVINGKLVGVSVNCETKHVITQKDKLNGYLVPKNNGIEYSWTGSTLDGKPWSATCQPDLGDSAIRMDILESIPWMVKKLVKAISCEPFVYQWFIPAEADIQIDQEKMNLQGVMFSECTFLNE